MIELKHDRLVFSFPEVHPEASLSITFQRTLRIPDDERTYPLPPGLGNFPIRHVDDFSQRVPDKWMQHGGVMLPMYQSEAMWIYFSTTDVDNRGQYPFAIRVLTGKIDAVCGEEYVPGLRKGSASWMPGRFSATQNYVVSPGQPWLDGYCVERGVVRQFVAMPLGDGYSAEEQITGAGEHGGIQVIVYPMKREAFERHFRRRTGRSSRARMRLGSTCFELISDCDNYEMGIAPGGKIKQEIFADKFNINDWHQDEFSRCFVHVANSIAWRQITRSAPPTKPPTAKNYSQAGLPWYDYYDDNLDALDSQPELERLLSVNTLQKMWHDTKLPDNKSCDPEVIISMHKKASKDQVREGSF